MARAVRIRIRTACLIGVAVLLSSCTASHGYSSRGSTVRVESAIGCPQTLPPSSDIHNSRSGLKHLVPQESLVIGALICRYDRPQVPGPRALRSSTRVDLAHIHAFVAPLAAVSLRGMHGRVNCPSASGAVIIAALHYSHGPDLDLWYEPTGCQFIDNGTVQTVELANPSFEPAAHQLDPAV